MSYPKYCRYRAIMKGVEDSDDNYSEEVLRALGGFTVDSPNTRIMFCRDVFDYPDLEGHELLCNHLAPKLKGRPRGKRKKLRSISPGSESNESESSISNVFNSSKSRESTVDGSSSSTRRSSRGVETAESKAFVTNLISFMKEKQTPIGRIPSLGFKELDLHMFYLKVQKLGGYDSVTNNKSWKNIFDEMTGNQACTSAATVIRRHYERYLLSYERHEKGEEHKPLPVLERRRLKSKQGSASTSDAENSESNSTSGNTTPIPGSSGSNTACTTPDAKTCDDQKIKLEVKPSSSLRSVRVKPERLRDLTKDKLKEYVTTLNEVKSEKAETSDPEDIKPPNLCEKNAEPVTSAVAPIQKPASTEKASPTEGKENVPLLNVNEPSGDNVEVPYKAKTPEVIDLESDAYKAINVQCNTYVPDVKKKKLDILKEGGLEVTAVQGFTPLERRPSVIQQLSPSVQIGNVTVTADKRSMPPPQGTNPKQSPSKVKSQSASPKTSFSYLNGNFLPKVVQSNSIYAPSDKMTYGDPKMFANPVAKTTATDILDLTVKNPKATVEIVKVPGPPPAHNNHPSIYKPAPPSSMVDPRKIGSNLEITLVNNPNMKNHPALANYPSPYTPNIPAHSNNKNYKYSSMKRAGVENGPLPKIPRMEENGRMNYPFYPERKENGADMQRAHHYTPSKSKNDVPKSSTKPDHHSAIKNAYPPGLPPSMYPHYNAAVAQSNQMNKAPQMGAHNMELLSQIYALQNLYPQNHLAGVPQLMPTQEQLQFYSDLIAHTSRMRFPFPFTQDSAALNNAKKP